MRMTCQLSPYARHLLSTFLTLLSVILLLIGLMAAMALLSEPCGCPEGLVRFRAYSALPVSTNVEDRRSWGAWGPDRTVSLIMGD